MARNTAIFLLFYNNIIQIILQVSIGISISSSKVLLLDELQNLDRNAVELYDIIKTKTNCSFLELTSLVNYGNWCGLGNNGETPIDNIDACCQNHDMCYDNVMNSGQCKLPHPSLVTYTWSPRNNDNEDKTLVCNDCPSDSVNHKTTTRKEDDESAQCSCQTCMCDVQLAECLHKVHKCPPPLFGILEKK